MIEYLTYIVNGDYWKLFDAGATFLSAYVIVYGAIKLLMQNLFKFYYYNKFDKNTIIVLGLGNETKTYIDASELKSKIKL